MPTPIPAKIAETFTVPAPTPWHSVAISRTGSVILQRLGNVDDPTPRVMALDQTGKTHIYPNILGSDPSKAVHLNDPVFVTSDTNGDVWLLDNGHQTHTDAMLVRVDGTTGHITAQWGLPSRIISKTSSFSAVRIHWPYAYLVDQGHPALAVIDLRDGNGRRFLDDDASLRGRRAMVVAGKAQLGPDQRAIEQDADMLALSHDGHWLFYQPPCGPLYRIDTALLTDPAYTPVEQLDGIAQWRDTPTLGGLTINRDDTIYMTDRTEGQLLSFGTARLPFVIMRDPRLSNAGGPAVGSDGSLYVPVADGPAILRISLPRNEDAASR